MAVISNADPGTDRGFGRTLVRYLVVGVLNTCVGLGTIYLGLYALHLHDVTANLIGYSLGIVLSFTLNKFWTFSDFRAAGLQFPRFLFVTAIAYLANLAAVEACIFAGVGHYLAQAVGIAPYTIIGYAGSRYFAFRA